MAKGKHLPDPNSMERDKMLLDSGVRALPKVLEACMGEATLPTDPTQNRMAQPQHALAQRRGIVAKYASGCCNVAPATR